MSPATLEVPLSLRRGGRRTNVQRAFDDSLKLERIVCRSLGLDNLADKRVLDVGCGWRMTKALLDQALPIGHYTGLDVFGEAIEFLTTCVDDPRFDLHVLDAHNEMYNPDGKALGDIDELPVETASYDIIWLFSVFTHLAPHDYAAMLRLLRGYVTPDGKLLFSLFINESTPNSRGFMDNMNRQWEQNATRLDTLNERATTYLAERKIPDIVDFDPRQPLKWAIYSREHALALIEGSGWRVEQVHYPEEAILHYIVCSPVGQ